MSLFQVFMKLLMWNKVFVRRVELKWVFRHREA